MNEKVNAFKRKSDDLLRKFHKENPSVQRFSAPCFTDSIAQERMMRIGVEARALQANEVEEFYVIALATLQNDFVLRNQ